jgi:hypothetical protein
VSQDAVESTVQDHTVPVRLILKWVFWIWGLVGLMISLGQYSSASQSASIGVGTSAYLMVGILLWIGGMILFGIAALLEERPVNRRSAAFYEGAAPSS